MNRNGGDVICDGDASQFDQDLDVEDTSATAGKERAQKDIGEIAALNGRAAPYIGQRPLLLERLRSSIHMRWHWRTCSRARKAQ
jgi:hypothetical protein